MAAPVEVVAAALPPADVAAVRQLVDAATAADGVPPLSEHVLLHLPLGGDRGAVNLLVRDATGGVAGYAHLDASDQVEGAAAELVVHPGQRQHGTGSALVAELCRQAPAGRLRLWAHGEHPGAKALATRHGFHRTRVLWQMQRPLLGDPLPEPELTAGVAVRTFRPGQDDEAWVALNNRAFADHPDQGRWQLADLRMRAAESWFDPSGFFLAERAGRLVGFHWTKVHGRDDHAHPPIGEVYVVGVDPAEQGSGLGRVLTLVGLRHLAGLGLPRVMLYVDESNEPAVRLYQGLGFTRSATDVSYATGG